MWLAIKFHYLLLDIIIPIVSRPYKMPFAQKSRLKEELKEMEGQGIIRRSGSPFASSVVILQKKDLTIRICPDHRK